MSPTRIALLLSLLTATLPAQPPPAPAAIAPDTQPIPTIHVTSRLVELDVIVTDNAGKPVHGLKQSDFNLTEDGAPQSLVDFTEHDASSNVPIAPEPPPPPNTFVVQPPPPESVTKTIIVLNQLHYPSYPFVRADIRTFMQTVAAGNPICIIRLDWRGLHLVQNFTSDPRLLQQAIDGTRMLPPLPNIDPLHASYHGIPNPYGALARYLDGVPGRINLAWVTDAGQPDDFIGQEYPEITAFAHDLRGSTDVLKLSRVTFYAIQVCGYAGCPNPLTIPGVPEIVLPTIPNTISELPGDPELMPSGTGGGLLSNQALSDLATSLGGHAFFDGTDKALAQILAVGSEYYTLSYVPTNPNWNGKYRQIAINVSGIPQTSPSRFGWTDYGQPKATYRRGYYARSVPDPNAERNLTAFGLDTPSSVAPTLVSAAPLSASAPHSAPAMEKALGFGTFPPSQIQFTIAVSPSAETENPKAGAVPEKGNFVATAFRNLPYRNYRVHYWIDPKDLKFSRLANGSYRDDLRFIAIVYSDDGSVANSVSTTAHIQASANNLENITTDGVIFDENISIPTRREAPAVDVLAPNFFLRVGVDEVSTNHIGALEVPVESIKLPYAQTLAFAP